MIHVKSEPLSLDHFVTYTIVLCLEFLVDFTASLAFASEMVYKQDDGD